jgi:nucleoside-diphosphate-sugar epimerase
VGAPPPRSLPRPAARALAAVIAPAWRLLRLRSRPLLTPDSLRLLSSEYTISLDRVRRELGFEPRVSYAEGLARVEAYWREFSRR